MVFRILYRLFLQHFDHRRSRPRQPYAGPVLIGQNSTRIVGAAGRRGFSGWALAVALVLVGSLALGWHYSQRNFYHGTVHPATDRANLRLSNLESATWPLVVYLQGAESPPPKESQVPSEIGRIESINGRFVPRFQVLSASTSLEIVNSDPIAHNTHVFNRGETIFNVGLPMAGVIVKKTLTGTGIFSVRCDLHPSMKAWLFVPPSPHFAVLSEPDTVNFPNLAAGEYVLHVWRAGGVEHLRLIELAAGETRTLHLR